MAVYPYTGGMYGGYSDPANNKKKTFIGPSADETLKAAPAAIKENPDTGAAMVSDAGASRKLLQKTPGGYPNVGLSVKPAATPPREMPLNIPGNDGQVSLAARNLLNTPPQQQPVSFFGKTGSISMNENAHPNSLARTAAPLSPPPAQPLKATLPGGIAYEGDLQGNRTHTMGTPGQDGYGRMSVRPGTGAAPAVNALATGAGQQTRNIGGLTVSGPNSAVERLAAPVGNVDYNSPRYQQFVAQNRAKDAYVNRDVVNPLAVNAPQSPKYMTKEEGIAAGIGWKGRLGKYKEDVDAFNKATGNLAQLDVAAMQEAGAGRRALLSAQGTNDANELARQRLMGEQGLNDARIKSEGINQQKGQMEVDSLKDINSIRAEYMKNPTPENETIYRAAIGKFEKEAQYGTVGRYDDQGMKIGEDRYNKMTGELKTENGGQKVEAPSAAIEYLKKNPGQSQFFKQKYGYLPDGF